MKYSIALALLSLIMWHYDYPILGGTLGFLSGFFYLWTYQRKKELLLIAVIGTSAVAMMLFPFPSCLTDLFHIGLAWSITIFSLFVILVCISFIAQTAKKWK